MEKYHGYGPDRASLFTTEQPIHVDIRSIAYEKHVLLMKGPHAGQQQTRTTFKKYSLFVPAAVEATEPACFTSAYKNVCKCLQKSC